MPFYSLCSFCGGKWVDEEYSKDEEAIVHLECKDAGINVDFCIPCWVKAMEYALGPAGDPRRNKSTPKPGG